MSVTMRPLHVFAAAYAAVWVWSAISPFNRMDWVLENVLVVVAAIVLVVSWYRFRFSELSYCLILLFLILHSIGAHYTYEKSAPGNWMKAAFEFERNHYDRVVHFAFGALLTYPLFEMFRRWGQAVGGFAYYYPVATILAYSALYEVIEACVAGIVSPGLGDAYLGTQGDVWDAQKDSACAFAGTLIAAAVTAVTRGKTQRV